MILKRTFTAVLLGCTMLAGCDGSNDKPAPASSTAPVVSQDTQGTFEALKKTANDLNNVKNNYAELQAILTGVRQDLDKALTESSAHKADLAALKKPLIEKLGAAIDDLQPLLKQSSENAVALGLIDKELAGLLSDMSALEARTTNSEQDKAELVSLIGSTKQLQQEQSEALKASQATRLGVAQVLDTVKNLDESLKNATIGLAELNGLIAQAQKLKVDLDTGLPPEQKSIAANSVKLESLRTAIADIQGLSANQSLANYVNTTRGSLSHNNDSAGIARGNNFPATAVPFGFNMWTPVNTSDANWFYNSTSNIMRAFAVTHEASGHNGNHQSLQIMPVVDQTATSAAAGSQTFQRKNEIAKAHYYSVTFDNKMKTEITPTDHAAYFRFTAPDTREKTTIFFDDFTGGGSLKIDEVNGIVSGYTLHGAHDYTPRMYFFAKFDNKIPENQRRHRFMGSV